MIFVFRFLNTTMKPLAPTIILLLILLAANADVILNRKLPGLFSFLPLALWPVSPPGRLTSL